MLCYLATSLSLEQLIWKIVSWLYLPVACLISLILVLQISGKSLGFLTFYVNGLLKVFEWASRRIEKAERENWPIIEEEEDLISDLIPRRDSARSLIQKDATARLMRQASVPEPDQSKVLTFIEDSLDFLKAGTEAIIDDEVTSRFAAEELASWNLLTRTSIGYQNVSLRLALLWWVGFALRYFLLFPIRFIIFLIGLLFLIIGTGVVGCIPDGSWKRSLNRKISLISYRILCLSVSALITYHNEQYMAKPGGICVANHTSPIDVVVLSCGNCYALVGQKHGGILGIVQRALNRASSHIWFERGEASDRSAVSRRLHQHVEDHEKLPILIFPEGTCINNTSVMMFKKGCFDVGGVIYPAAVKYDAKFADAFWNSSKQSYMEYLIMMMTSWAVVVDIYYLPPMLIQEGENAIDFAARVKKAIAEAGGMVDLQWDGQLKRYPVKKELLEKQRERYSRRISGSGVNLGLPAFGLLRNGSFGEEITKKNGLPKQANGIHMKIRNGVRKQLEEQIQVQQCSSTTIC